MNIGTTSRNSATGTSGAGLPGSLSATRERAAKLDGDAEAPAPSPTETEATLADASPRGLSFSQLRQREAEIAARKAEADAVPTEDDPYKGMTRAQRRAAKKEARQLGGTFLEHPMLMALKPKERYLFRSDYFEVDNGVAAILGYFHADAAREDFGAFWGINRIPKDLPDGVTTIILEQVRRKGEKWVEDRVKTAEKLDSLDEGEQATSGSMSSRRRAAKIADDTEIITGEIQDGASYLHVHNRLLIKAPDLKTLDESIDRIRRDYIERFNTLKIAAYPGEQRQELTNLFGKNEKKRGKGFHFTSTEHAGSHMLVTNGLNDPTGEYVGFMVGDVNNSAVNFDVNMYDHHVVVADSTVNPFLDRAMVSGMWGSKISQSGLLSNAKVVHIVLDGTDLNKLGPKLNNLTARLDMNSGDINMFELFGDEGDELGIFPSHLEKIVLMAEQAYETTDQDRSIIRGSLKETLTQFYIDKNMWARNAKHNRAQLRVVNIPHNQVPRLQDIVTYFETQYKALSNSHARDDEQLHAFNVLRLVFKDLLDGNGDLFNTHTNDEIDSVGDARRVVYDFSRLLKRGKGIAMAQLVNVIGFAVDSLGLGDTIIIHGTERIDDRIKEYIDNQFEHLFHRGGRVAYLYNSVDKMLTDSKFNQFDAADWTVLGPMRDATVAEYQKQLHQDIPRDLERLVTTKGENLAYLRRGHTNVVFRLDLSLGINVQRAERRRQLLGKEAREQVGSTMLSAAQGERAAEREQQVAESGAEARLKMTRDREKKEAAASPRMSPNRTTNTAQGPRGGRMTRNR